MIKNDDHVKYFTWFLEIKLIPHDLATLMAHRFFGMVEPCIGLELVTFFRDQSVFSRIITPSLNVPSWLFLLQTLNAYLVLPLKPEYT